jgi:hypothetical protein
MKKMLPLYTLFLLTVSCKNNNEQYILNSIGLTRMLCPNIKNELNEIPVVNIDLSTYNPDGMDTPQSSITAIANMQPTNATDSLVVNGINIPYKIALNSMTRFSSQLNKSKKSSGDDGNQEELYALFGREAYIYFSSKELGNVSGILKTVEPIRLSINDKEKTLDSFSLLKDLKIMWNKDTLNKNPVYISLVENKFPDFKSKSNQLESSKTMTQWHKLVEDTGVLYIKSSELQIFHKESNYMIDVFIVRGSYTILNTSKGKKAFIASKAQSHFYLPNLKQ